MYFFKKSLQLQCSGNKCSSNGLSHSSHFSSSICRSLAVPLKMAQSWSLSSPGSHCLPLTLGKASRILTLVSPLPPRPAYLFVLFLVFSSCQSAASVTTVQLIVSSLAHEELSITAGRPPVGRWNLEGYFDQRRHLYLSCYILFPSFLCAPKQLWSKLCVCSLTYR